MFNVHTFCYIYMQNWLASECSLTERPYNGLKLFKISRVTYKSSSNLILVVVWPGRTKKLCKNGHFWPFWLFLLTTKWVCSRTFTPLFAGKWIKIVYPTEIDVWELVKSRIHSSLASKYKKVAKNGHFWPFWLFLTTKWVCSRTFTPLSAGKYIKIVYSTEIDVWELVKSCL